MMEPLDFCLITTIPKNNYFSLTYHSESAWYFLDCMVIILPRGKTNALSLDTRYLILDTRYLFPLSSELITQTSRVNLNVFYTVRGIQTLYISFEEMPEIFLFLAFVSPCLGNKAPFFCGAVYLLFFRYSPSVLPPPPPTPISADVILFCVNTILWQRHFSVALCSGMCKHA